MIAVERKRTERSRKPFLLMLLDAGNHQGSEKNGKALNNIVPALLSSTRETDVIGWYKDRATVGVIFTGLVADDKNSILSTILTRVSTTLRDKLDARAIQSSQHLVSLLSRRLGSRHLRASEQSGLVPRPVEPRQTADGPCWA